MDKAAFRDFTIQIVKRSDTAKGFEIVPRRWVVERTFGWMTRWRRLVRDYEMPGFWSIWSLAGARSSK
jgi:putative transposase